MNNEILGHLFISYSHTDKPYMLTFRKHLQGMLRNKMQVWSDLDISKGTEWESLLKGNLNQASSALVLATPDYLVSTWCRLELKQLADAHRTRRLRNVFWVQLKPCGWQHTELAALQSIESSAELAITELSDETQCQRAILQVCAQIASEIARSITEQDKTLAFVRRLLLDVPDHHDITVNEVIHAGNFSIVCRGLSGSMNAAIKVFRRAPLEKMAEAFLKIGQQRKIMSRLDPSFIHIHHIFQGGTEGEQRIITVSDYVDSTTQLSTVFDKCGPICVDKVALLLRRMAAGLAQLHKAAGSKKTPDERPENEWEWTLGLLTPDDLYYDEHAERLRVPPIGVSSFLWHVFDCATYVDWVDPEAQVYVSPEQKKIPRERLTPKTDQYMLGRLGVELLEGLRFKRILDRKSATVEEFWREPESFIEGSWRTDHQQLWDILKRLLKIDPKERYGSMKNVVNELSALEEEGRALAKRVYLAPLDTKADHTLQLKDNMDFFKQFYEAFFQASPDSKEKFNSINQEKQRISLMKSMVAVLNFRPGNEPTSLTDIVEKHRNKGISKQEFEKFRESFLDTMDKFTNKDKDQTIIREAWAALFKPVIDYMISECVDRSSAPQEPGAGSTDGANAHEVPSDKTDVKRKTKRQKTQ